MISLCFSSEHPSGQKDDSGPNILFLVVEDTSPYLFPAYGNQTISTPNLDRLASQGVVFTNAFANSPYSSPARSALISGSYATTYGNDWHRNNHIVPQQYFFPQYLREAGYFTVNAGKTDYNVTREVGKAYYDLAWDRMSSYRRGDRDNVTYNDPYREDRPFFGQFNNNTTHMSRLTSIYLNNREPSRINPEEVDLPSYVPDIPETRSDYALHLEGVEDSDKWVGIFIDDLEKRDLLDNTIIFFFSDHGGNLPRGKAFPFESGLKAALIIYAPPRWEHLLPADVGTISNRIVEFADFGPTLLSVAGVKPPGHMQGKPFMGKYEAPPRDMSFNYRTNTHEHFDPSRSLYTKKFEYTVNYTPYKIHGKRQIFQWGMPSQMAWDSLFNFAEVTPEHQGFYLPKPREMLFDREKDPWSMNNLAKDPAYKDVLDKFRNAVSRHIRETKDLGFFPLDVRNYFVDKGISLYSWVHESSYPFELMYRAVESASLGDPDEKEFLVSLLEHERPEIRYWGASGLANMAHQGQLDELPLKLFTLTNDPFGSVAVMAAEALVHAGSIDEGLNCLIKQAKDLNTFASTSLEQLGPAAEPALADIRKLAMESDDDRIRFYARSVLVNFGELPLHELFDEPAVERFLRIQKRRVREWAPTLP